MNGRRVAACALTNAVSPRRCGSGRPARLAARCGIASKTVVREEEAIEAIPTV